MEMQFKICKKYSCILFLHYDPELTEVNGRLPQWATDQVQFWYWSDSLWSLRARVRKAFVWNCLTWSTCWSLNISGILSMWINDGLNRIGWNFLHTPFFQQTRQIWPPKHFANSCQFCWIVFVRKKQSLKKAECFVQSDPLLFSTFQFTEHFEEFCFPLNRFPLPLIFWHCWWIKKSISHPALVLNRAGLKYHMALFQEQRFLYQIVV